MIELSIKRPLIVFVFFAIIALLGFVTFRMLNVNLIPKIETNIVTIATIYPGASASEVETSVTKKIEDAVSSIENIDKLSSVSQEGFSLTTIQLKSSANPNLALQDAQRKVNAAMADLPKDVKTPTISKFSPDEMPVIQLGATSEMVPTAFQKIMEDQVQPRLAKLQGVGQITLVGGTERQIRVNVDQNKLKAYNISILQILPAIQRANMDFPTGRIEETSNQYTVRLAAKYTTIDQLKNTAIVVAGNGGTIFVKDVADVTDGIAEATKINRLNGVSSIGVLVQKQSDANTVDVCKNVKAELAAIEKEYAASHMKFVIASDNSQFTMESVNAVVEDLVLAVLIVSIVCFIFLHSFRSAVIVMVAVPLSMLPAFIVMYMFGYTLNVMSLMSLSLAVGILVDDSIVVVENIFRHLEMGKTKLQAALDGSREIFYTATSITLVIVSVFIPISLTGGIIGNILKEFALPLIVSTLTSLVVSFTLTPLLQSRFGKVEDITRDNVMGTFSRGVEAAFEELKHLYERFVTWGLEHRWIVYVGVTVLVVGSLSMLPAGLIGGAFMPDTDQSEFVVDLEYGPQTSVHENNRITQQVEHVLFADPRVVKVMTNVGTSSSVIGSSARNNVAQLTVHVIDKNARSIKVQEMAETVKMEILRSVPGVKVRVAASSLTGSASSAPIEYIVKGTDLHKVDSAAAFLRSIIRNTPGTTDVRYSIDDAKPEVHIQINREEMQKLGLTAADVGMTLQLALAGNTDSKFNDGPYEYKINVGFDTFDKQNIFDVAGISFANNRGQLVELKQFADISQSNGPSMLERNDRMSSITVRSNVVGRATGTVGTEIKEKYEGNIPDGVVIEPSGMLKAQGDAFQSLGIAMLAAVILVYLIMVALYNSLLHPFIVTFSIPVAIVGAFFALGLTMENLTIFSILGLITLMGLVVKNAILLVDFTNNLLRDGKDIKHALIEAGKERLRPILMTTLAMVFGMLPLAIAGGAASEMKNGMAWVIIGGLLSSLVLTLVLVPCVYYSFESTRRTIALKRRMS